MILLAESGDQKSTKKKKARRQGRLSPPKFQYLDGAFPPNHHPIPSPSCKGVRGFNPRKNLKFYFVVGEF